MRLKVARSGKELRPNTVVSFLSQKRELLEEAFAGDIIGIPNHGVLQLGDTLTEGEPLQSTGLPFFAPEMFRSVEVADPLRTKQLRAGLTQLVKPMIGSQWIVGVVGQLQLEVLISRLEAEYRVAAAFEPSPFETARWISGDAAELKRFMDEHKGAMAEDRDGAPVFMARDAWELNYTSQRETAIRFSATRERA
jgi:peptide chain release factor 3